MSSFVRESAAWFFRQRFFLEMSKKQRESWLQYRETVTMRYEDPLWQREQERHAMGSHDVVELSRLRRADDDDEDAADRRLVLSVWDLLGGGEVVRRRLQRQ